MADLSKILELPTPRLLTYYKKYYRERRGRMEYEYYTCGHITKEAYDAFMVDYNKIKNALDVREHVNTK